MGCLKHYYLRLICSCAPHNLFAQDALEWFILEGRIHLTGQYWADVKALMREYDAICRAYHQHIAQLPLAA